jgi:hypothetical protein
VAIEVAAIGQGSGGGTGNVQVTFNADAVTTFGQNVFVVGSIPVLGNWAPGRPLRERGEAVQWVTRTTRDTVRV